MNDAAQWIHGRSGFRRDSDMRKYLVKLTSLLSVALAVALSAPQRATADDDDPPSRVARLSYTHGNVSFNPAGTDDWVTAVVNRCFDLLRTSTMRALISFVACGTSCTVPPR